MALGFTTIRPLGSPQSSSPGGVPYRTGAAPAPSSGFTVQGPNAFSTNAPASTQGSDPWTIKGNPAFQQPTYASTPAPDYSSRWDAANAYYGPDQVALNQQYDKIGATTAERARYDAAREAGLRTDYSIGQRGADLDMRGIGIDKGAATRDAAYYQKLLSMMPAYRNLSGLDLNTAISEAQRQGNMQRIANDSAATAGGGWFAPMRQVKNYDSYLGQANAEQRASTNYYRDQLGLNEKEAGLDRSKSMTGDQLAKLDLEAARVGLSREKLQAALDQGLAALGYDKFINAQQLLDMKNSLDPQQAALAQKIWDMVYGNGAAISGGQLGDEYMGSWEGRN